jgi:tRNA modification GTPase
MSNPHDTICALSTAPGRAGIAIVRLSGDESFRLVQRVFVPDGAGGAAEARRATLGSIVDPLSAEKLDRALVTRFPAPGSYTGEDVAEISLHGSPVLIAVLLDRLCSLGARLAEPGEFTMRAFLNGRMDLAQAEAIHDVIQATTLYQAQVAARQRDGQISRQLGPIEKALIDVIVQLEAAVEFVEEDLALESRSSLAGKIESISREMKQWIDSFRRGRIVRDGFSMAIVGKPNVGKSSLFNALLRQERSIVTEMPGTTRDMISEFTSLEGIPMRLLDTAGVRASGDRVEQLGIDRSLQAIVDADAILLVVDASCKPDEEDEDLQRRLLGLSCIVVMNKCDLAGCWTAPEKSRFAGEWPRLEVSAKTGAHIDLLRKEILEHLFGAGGSQRDGILVTNLRHCRCLESAETHLQHAANALRVGLSEEFVLFDLHAGLHELGAITGKTSADDLLGEIFSRFCIGK